MTAKEKAQELYLKMEATIWGFEVLSEKPKEIAKQCALICVQEIILSNPQSNPLNTSGWSTMEYWNQVKQEIENI